MRKFNPEAELSKIQKENNTIVNSSKFSNIFIPMLVIACSCLAMIGVTFSTKLVNDVEEKYDIRVDIINGNQEVYKKTVSQGAFRDTINGLGTFGSISCTTGNLEYDPVTSTISSVLINEDTNCVLAFMDDGLKNINFNNLSEVNDNFGISYYYKADATNNYLRFNDMMFRIVRINGDGTLRLILDDSTLSANYGEINNYEDSNVKVTLDNWFNNNFNYEDIEYLVQGDFDIQNYVEYSTYNLIDMDGYYLSYVGALSVREAEIISKNIEGDNYLNSESGYYLSNSNGAYNAYIYKNGKVDSVDANNILSVRPVINMKKVTLSGQGTEDNPYVVE